MIDEKALERVARAICLDIGENPDTATPHNKHVEFLWQHYRTGAEAAITEYLAAREEAGFVEVQGWRPISDSTPRDGELIHIWTMNAPPSVPYIFASWVKDSNLPFKEDGGYWRDAATGYPYRPSEVLYWCPLNEGPPAMLAKGA